MTGHTRLADDLTEYGLDGAAPVPLVAAPGGAARMALIAGHLYYSLPTGAPLNAIDADRIAALTGTPVASPGGPAPVPVLSGRGRELAASELMGARLPEMGDDVTWAVLHEAWQRAFPDRRTGLIVTQWWDASEELCVTYAHAQGTCRIVLPRPGLAARHAHSHPDPLVAYAPLIAAVARALRDMPDAGDHTRRVAADDLRAATPLEWSLETLARRAWHAARDGAETQIRAVFDPGTECHALHFVAANQHLRVTFRDADLPHLSVDAFVDALARTLRGMPRAPGSHAAPLLPPECPS